jgi:hypothetical protein
VSIYAISDDFDVETNDPMFGTVHAHFDADEAYEPVSEQEELCLEVLVSQGHATREDS